MRTILLNSNGDASRLPPVRRIQTGHSWSRSHDRRRAADGVLQEPRYLISADRRAHELAGNLESAQSATGVANHSPNITANKSDLRGGGLSHQAEVGRDSRVAGGLCSLSHDLGVPNVVRKAESPPRAPRRLKHLGRPISMVVRGAGYAFVTTLVERCGLRSICRQITSALGGNERPGLNVSRVRAGGLTFASRTLAFSVATPLPSRASPRLASRPFSALHATGFTTLLPLHATGFTTLLATRLAQDQRIQPLGMNVDLARLTALARQSNPVG